MYRISALNDVNASESGDVAASQVPVQQLQESQVLKRYNEALATQRKGDVNKAIEVYKELLETAYLVKAEPVENSQDPSPNGISPIYGKTDLNIKYSCYRNLAEIHRDLGKLSLALNFYLSALEIDGTDVNTWYKVGIIASKLGLIHLAPTAFLRGIKCSSHNWPCLDRAAISLVVEGDYPLAMEVISCCFEINPDYQRGLALRDIMLETESWLKTDMALLCPQADLQFDRPFNGPEEIRDKLKTEIKTLQDNFQLWKKREADKPIVYLELVEPLNELSWRAMGEAFMALFKWFENSNESILQRRVNLLTSLPDPKAEDAPTEGLPTLEEDPMDVEPCEKKDTDVETELHEAEGAEERRSRRRTGSALMEELLLSGKRRSTRVRTCRKEQESMSVADALTNILPRCLLHKRSASVKRVDNIDDESMDTMDLYKLFEKQVVTEQEHAAEDELKDKEEKLDHDNLAQNEGYFNTLQEENDVKTFLETQDKETFLEILKAYVLTMEKFWTKTWPKKLVPVFIDCYQAFRKYYGISPQFLNYKEIRQHTYEESGATLLYHELMVDCEKCGEDILPLQLMHNIVELACYPEEFPDAMTHAIYELRIMWMRAQLFIARGETSEAIYYFETALNCYTDHPELENHTVHLRNCQRNQLISRDIVIGTLDAHLRKKNLSEVIRLYNERSYKEVAGILRDHVNSVGNSKDDFLGRKKLMDMLINTLYHLDEYKECLYWLETSIYELLNNSCKKPRSEDETQEWKVAFDQLLVAIDECCEWGEFTIYDALPKTRLPRFVQTLCQAICRQLEDSERPPCASRPWMTLNSILVAMEAAESPKPVVRAGRDSCSGDDSDNESDGSAIPPSVLLLFTAHEYLGRREWCNCDGNVLLFLIMDQVISRLRSPEWVPFRETVQKHLDQVVFCLYAHPSKKTKTRNIVDHNVSPIPLTWERAIQLFELYRPDEMPSFDSLRTCVISADTEVLFKRIVSLIPEHINPEENVEHVQDFIYKRREDLPEKSVKLPQKIMDIFYILGDYYLKTYDSGAALKHLLIDLSFNNYRFDAWASLALSKVSDLDSSLNSCDPLQNDDFLKEAIAAIRCYEYSMNLGKSVCSLWIEYGNFAYTVHSFCSQRMKLESESLSLDQFEEIETTKTKMLEVAKNAFLNANNIWSKSNDEDTQDERWLHYYMLGKIAEKSGDLTYLQYYEKANDLLYENNAQYPKKISYNAPQALAIEAMEIYYRAHVCVIKCLELHDGEPLDEKTRGMFVKFLEKFANGPFVRQLSKSDLTKQKVKELDAAEQANIRELNSIRHLVSNVISEVERREEAERTEIRRMIETIVLDIVDASITPDPVEDKSEIPPKKVSATTPPNEVVLEEKMEIQQKQEDTEQDEVDAIRKSPADSQASAKSETLVVGDVNNAAVECIDLLSDEDENKPSKDDLDAEMLKLAATLAEAEPEPVKAADPAPKTNLLECAAVGFATSAAMPPNVPFDCLEYHQETTFEPYPHEQVPEDNYYYTLDDLKGPPALPCKVKSKSKIVPSSAKKKRKICRERVSSSSSSSDDNIAYADDSSGRSASSSSSSSDEKTEEEAGRKRKKRPCRPPQQHVVPKADDASQTTVSEALSQPSEPVDTTPTTPLDSEEMLLQQCISAFELCAVRFPQHYKSVYRLAHFFYRSKKHRDLEKCRQLLLGTYVSAFGNIGGLFAENKNTNFFNGIWRLPSAEVDRPGNFASHMSRSVMLLLEVLRDLRDHKLLLQLCLQLRKVPEREKKYLREDERLPLSKQALTLSLQSLRYTVKYVDVMTLPIVLDAYRVYLRVQKHCPSKEGAFGDCLRDAFNRLGKGTTSLEQCLKFCQGELTGNRMAFPSQSPTLFKSKIRRTRKTKDSDPVKPALPKAATPPPTETAKEPEDKDSGLDLSVTDKEKDIASSESKTAKDSDDVKSCESGINTGNEPTLDVGGNKEPQPNIESTPQTPITNPAELPGISLLPAIDLSRSVAKVMSQSSAEPKSVITKARSFDIGRDIDTKPKSSPATTPEAMVSSASSADSRKHPDMSRTKISSTTDTITGASLSSVAVRKDFESKPKTSSTTETITGASLSPVAVRKDLDSKPKTSSNIHSTMATKVSTGDRDPKPKTSTSTHSTTVAKPAAMNSASGSSKKSAVSSAKPVSQASSHINDMLNYMQNYALSSGFANLPSTQPLFGLPNLMASNEAYNQQFNYMANYLAQLQSQMLAENPVQQRKKQSVPPPARTTAVSSKTESMLKPFQEKPRSSQASPVLPLSKDPSQSAPRAHSSKPSAPNPSATAGLPLTPSSSSHLKFQSYPKPTQSSKYDKFLKSPSTPSTSLPDAKRASPVIPKPAEPPASSLGKFNIDEILKKNPGITITQKKLENHSEAMNLSSKSASEASKRPAVEEPKKPAKRPSPEIVILDD